MDDILRGLNSRQLEAVTHSPNSRLQIIAGPGTGKTTVLVSRVAYLLIVAKIPPGNIIVTTFTKRAANEMLERLEPVMKDTGVDILKLLIGTFHSVCFRLIKRYGKLLGLSQFTIADERDSTAVLSAVFRDLDPTEERELKDFPEEVVGMYLSDSRLDVKHKGFDLKRFKKDISLLKSNAITSEEYKLSDARNSALSMIYSKYQKKLELLFLLDFDDCLLRCYHLISTYPVLNFVQHVLVDEFQDTNKLQLHLMYKFAEGLKSDPKSQHNVTIVGDPDQSIYAFRDAEVGNTKTMKHYYTTKIKLAVSTVLLDENYRSSQDILEVSEKIMRQQVERQKKSLKSQAKASFKPVFQELGSAEAEAEYISEEISLLHKLPGLFDLSDIAILVRSAYQTRIIENALLKARLPYHMVRGKAFWERLEITAMVDYLRISANPNDKAAFVRTLQYPKKGFGDKSAQALAKYLDECDLTKGSVISYVEKWLNSSANNSKKQVVSDHVLQIKNFQEQAQLLSEDNTETMGDFFDSVYQKSGVHDALEEDEERVANVSELRNLFINFHQTPETLDLYVGGDENMVDDQHTNLVLDFISSIGLSEVSTSADEKDGPEHKISLSTIHGAKGLEWAVVFVPGLMEGLLPSRFALKGTDEKQVQRNIDEERRCFYVATTRAKNLLYMSGAPNRNAEQVSRFVSEIANNCSKKQSCFNSENRMKQLYSQRNVEYPEKSDIDSILFNRGVLWEQKHAGPNYAPKAQAFSTAKRHLEQLQPLNGFKSASRISKGPIRPPQSRPYRVGLAPGGNNQNRIPAFKKPQISTSSASKSHAPKYEYVKPKHVSGNKAPPYIPKR